MFKVVADYQAIRRMEEAFETWPNQVEAAAGDFHRTLANGIRRRGRRYSRSGDFVGNVKNLGITNRGGQVRGVTVVDVYYAWWANQGNKVITKSIRASMRSLWRDLSERFENHFGTGPTAGKRSRLRLPK